MTTAEYTPNHVDHQSWLKRAENWLDNKGRGAWIAATILGFVFFWPLGLALLVYIIWNKKMKNSFCTHRNRTHLMASSGNSAFDAYKMDTIKRLQDEQENFEAFLKRLRDAKDKAEFDEFLADREKQDA